MRIKSVHILAAIAVFILSSCNPEASWTTNDVTIEIAPRVVSAGYIECAFSTNKNAYYMIDCEPVEPGYDPLDPDHQKQFMTLALLKLNNEYNEWRYDLLKAGESHIAPFASHCLQYGTVNHYFTNLKPSTDYWIFAFAVNPETIQPAGRLFLQTVKTTDISVEDVHFEYRVQGLWDYIYPLNPDGKINSHFPYLSAIVDSITLATTWEGASPEEYFENVFLRISENNLEDEIRYGVQVSKNDGQSSVFAFEEGHTYYTAIVSYDGFMGNNVIYRFTWTGEDFKAYFTDEDNIVDDGENG